MERKLKLFNKEDMIRAISSNTGYDDGAVRNIIRAFEEEINSAFTEVTPDQDVEIKLITGVNLYGIYSPNKTKMNNITKKVDNVSARIKIKPEISRRFTENINNNKSF